MIYNCLAPDIEGTENESKNDDLNTGSQKVSYYFLTNSSKFNGWTNYIEEYYEINEGYSMVSDGCRKTLTYSDRVGFKGVSSKNFKFLPPVPFIFCGIFKKHLLFQEKTLYS